MHILHVTLGFLPAVAWGGPVKNVHLVSKEFIRRGHQVTIYCSNLLDKKKKIMPNTFSDVIDEIQVVYFNTWYIKSWPGTLGPFWMPELPGLLSKDIFKFDIIHINGYRNFINLPITRIATNHKIPYVLQPHGALPVVINSMFVKRLYDSFFGSMELKRMDALIATQRSEFQQALDRGIPANKIKIIPNGLEIVIDRHNDIPRGTFRKKFHLPKDCHIILFLARINKKKGADMLVEAFSKMKRNDVILVIAGPDDGQLEEVMEMVEKENLSNRVFFPGLLDGDDVWMAYNDASLFVLPCRTDTFPLTIIEACQANLPMVVTDTCEISGLIKNRIADVVPFNSLDFSNAMENLLADSQRYRRYKNNCPQMMIDTFSINTTVDMLESLYHEIISKH